MSPSTSPIAPLVGDDLALDFINTRYGTGDDLHECLLDDACVLEWLKRAGLLPSGFDRAPAGLLALALELREHARLLVNAAKASEHSDPSVINNVLEVGLPRKELRWNDVSKTYQAVEQRRDSSPASLLEPIARAVVDLLTNTALDRVKQCEAHDCTLMFRDLTKSHRRRWCSMASCGNRMKVAAFRQRQIAE